MRSIVATALVLLSALPASADTLEARLAPCLACHGAKGQSAIPEVPSLGGLPAFYLTIQLFMFREKLRVVEPMNQMTQGLSDDDLRNMADFIAKLPPPSLPTVPPIPPAWNGPRRSSSSTDVTSATTGIIPVNRMFPALPASARTTS